MFVNCFTITIPAGISDITFKELSEEFGKNIPGPLPYDGVATDSITYLFCVDANVNIEEICKKYNYEMGKPHKIQIHDYMYNNNYIIENTYRNYKKDLSVIYLKMRDFNK